MLSLNCNDNVQAYWEASLNYKRLLIYKVVHSLIKREKLWYKVHVLMVMGLLIDSGEGGKQHHISCGYDYNKVFTNIIFDCMLITFS